MCMASLHLSLLPLLLPAAAVRGDPGILAGHALGSDVANSTTVLEPTVCAVVPSVPAHWRLLPRALLSLREQTRPPDQIVVVSSHVKPHQCNVLHKRLSHGELIVCSSETGWTRGANRNRGASACGNATFVTFLDADDVMHPAGIARMLSLLDEHHADLGLHSYVPFTDQQPRWPARAPFVVTPPSVYAAIARAADSERRGDARFDHPSWKTTGPVHYGHATVRAEVMNSIRQRKDKKVGEDKAFAMSTILAGWRTVYTSEALTGYRKGTSVQNPRGVI